MKQTDRWIQDHMEEILRELRTSIQIPSVKGESAPGAPFGTEVRRALDHVLGIARRYGFETTDEEGYIGYADMPGGREMLGILAHVDVVDVSDHWTHPPFAGEIVDGCLYGRGAIDDKGPAIGTLYALAAVRACGYRFRRSVRIFFGCDEETGFGCINYYLENGGRMPDLSFSPDSEYPLVNSEKGICQMRFEKRFPSTIRAEAGLSVNAVPDSARARLPYSRAAVEAAVAAVPERDGLSFRITEEGEYCLLEVQGKAAHAGCPQEGRNALQALIAAMVHLPLAGEEKATAEGLYTLFRQECYGESCGLAMEGIGGRLTVNVSLLRWDETGICDLGIDCRCPPVGDLDQAAARLRACLEKIGLKQTAVHQTAGHYVAADTELPQKLLDVYEARFGQRPAPLSVGGGTYARCLNNAVGFGYMRPNIAYHAHMDDEMIPLDHYKEDICLMADAIVALACEGE